MLLNIYFEPVFDLLVCSVLFMSKFPYNVFFLLQHLVQRLNVVMLDALFFVQTFLTQNGLQLNFVDLIVQSFDEFVFAVDRLIQKIDLVLRLVQQV